MTIKRTLTIAVTRFKFHNLSIDDLYRSLSTSIDSHIQDNKPIFLIDFECTLVHVVIVGMSLFLLHCLLHVVLHICERLDTNKKSNISNIHRSYKTYEISSDL